MAVRGLEDDITTAASMIAQGPLKMASMNV